MDPLIQDMQIDTSLSITISGCPFRDWTLFKFDFCLVWCSNSLTTVRRTLPEGAPESQGEMQIFANSAFNSYIFSSQQGSTFCTTYQWQGGY